MSKVGIAFAAAIPAGIVFGLLLRVVMGIIAFGFPEFSTGFHWSALLLLTILGTLVLLGNSLIYALVRRWLPRYWAGSGLVYGTICAIVYGTPFYLSNPGGELFGPQAFLGISLFTLLFIWGGFSLAWSIDVLERWVGSGQRMRIRLANVSFVILVLPALGILFALGHEIVTEMIPEIRSNWQ